MRDSSRRFKKLRKDFYEQGRLDDEPCWLCLQPIDYTLPNGEPYAHELDHYYPVSTHPELQDDPANFRHAHAQCNQQRGNRIIGAELGERVAPWW